MAGRSLKPDEAEIWAKVAATVRRLDKHATRRAEPIPPRNGEGDRVKRGGGGSAPNAPPAFASPPPPQLRKTPTAPAETLDGGWDRRLRRGLVSPDRTIDLHGHTLSSAHAVLDRALERAVADGIRTLLVITGKPPRDPVPHRRGLIRAAIGDWLGASRHSGRIAAIRNAHPRHGGTGALYLIMRRVRP